MYAQAIDMTGHGRCRGRGKRTDLRVLWHELVAAAAAGGHGEYDEGHDEGSHGGHGPHHHRGGHHRHHGGPRGEFGPGLGGGFGGFPFGGPGGRGPRGRGRKARRGDIRTAALLLLAEEPRNGYQIMQEVQERSDGAWSPSPGSVYPALQQLEDEGLIRSEEQDGRKLFVLTDAGREHLRERGAQEPAPWEQMSGGFSPPAAELGKIMREVAAAFMQVMRSGSDTQLGQAREVLVRTRRDLYRILADGDPAAGEGDSAAGEGDSAEGDS